MKQLFVAVVAVVADDGVMLVVLVVEMLWESDNALIHKSASDSPPAIPLASYVVLCLDFYQNYLVTLDDDNADLYSHDYHYHLQTVMMEDLMLLSLLIPVDECHEVLQQSL